ncbi:MAG: ornithine carbamoyltransferase [Myxococcota bacterium]
MKHLIAIADLSPDEVRGLLDLAHDVKRKPKKYRKALRRKTLAMIFMKASTRTRVSFEVGMHQLGGHALFLSPRDVQIGRGEPISDTAKVLSRYVDGIMARTFAHQDVVDLATHGTVPVINGLTDFNHPCQGLSDLMTIEEKLGKLKGLTMAWVGDGNNMAHSLMSACVKTGMHFRAASPDGYTMDRAAVERAMSQATETGASVIEVKEPREAVDGADVVCTDVWASMGQEAEQEKRAAAFAGYIVDTTLMAHAKPTAIFMHCLPAHRGEEVSAEVCDGPQSVIYDQAENRLHMQKAIMITLMG